MSKKTGFTITIDDAALNTQLNAAIKRNPVETARRVRACLVDLAGESARRAPVDAGDLRNDCTAKLGTDTVFSNGHEGAQGRANLSSFGEVSYGLPYALRQHEDLANNHPRGGEAKYLERPFGERKGRYEKYLAAIPEEVLKE